MKSPFFHSAVVSIAISLLSACTTSNKTTFPTSRPASKNVPGTEIPNAITKDALPSALAQEVLMGAMQFIGKPYRWGGLSPAEGFDCSGLIVYVSSKIAQFSLPRTSREMATRGMPVEQAPMAPGDLVFFNTSGAPNSHVGIYAGNGRFIHSPSSKGVIRLESMNNPWWKTRFTQARRLFMI